MILKGVLTVIKEKELVGSYKKFSKRECVLRENSFKHEEILIEFHQDDCSMLNGYAVGEEVSIDINIRGRSWVNPEGETRYFNSIQGWKISYLNAKPI